MSSPAGAAIPPIRSPGCAPSAATWSWRCPGILLIGIIFGGVRSGVFTATESSCIAVIYALLVALLVYRELDWRGFVEAVQGAVRTTAMVLLVIGTAGAFGWLMALPAGADRDGRGDRRASPTTR